jgi:peptidyl-prolyl cis-trans isomerase SurA
VIHALLALALSAPLAAAPVAAAAVPAPGPAPEATAAAPAAASSPAAPAAEPAPPRRVLERVAATVNGEVVTLRELQERAGEEWRRADALGSGLDRDQALKRVLRRTWEVVLAEKLFHVQALQLQLETTDAQVEAAIEDIKRRNHFDDAQLDLALAGQGLDRAAFRTQIRRELESMQVLNYRVRSRVKVSEEDMQHYYQTHPAAFGGEEEFRVSHLLLPLPENAAPAVVEAARAEATRVRARLQAGEDFAAVVKEVSRGPGAEHGGDLGWLRRGSVQKSLEDAFLPLADGQVSAPVRVGPGLHLFKVVERRRSGGRTFAQAKEEIRDTLFQEQSVSYRDQYLAELKRDAAIDVRLPELKD